MKPSEEGIRVRVLRYARDIEYGDCVRLIMTAAIRKQIADELRTLVDDPMEDPFGCCPCENPLHHIEGCRYRQGAIDLAPLVAENEGLKKEVEDLHATSASQQEIVGKYMADVDLLQKQLAERDAELTTAQTKLRAADAVMKAIDRLVTAGLMDSRSEISDARLNYSNPHTYLMDAELRELRTEAIKAVTALMVQPLPRVDAIAFGETFLAKHKSPMEGRDG